jgi:hypothetical protein
MDDHAVADEEGKTLQEATQAVWERAPVEKPPPEDRLPDSTA